MYKIRQKKHFDPFCMWTNNGQINRTSGYKMQEQYVLFNYNNEKIKGGI
jgi:hypothetical protein